MQTSFASLVDAAVYAAASGLAAFGIGAVPALAIWLVGGPDAAVDCCGWIVTGICWAEMIIRREQR